MGGGAAADPTRPERCIGPIRVGTRGTGVGSAVWRGPEKFGLFFSLRSLQPFTYSGRGAPVGGPDRRSCLYRILPQTTGRSNCVLKTHPRAQTLAAVDPRNSPWQGERRPSSPEPFFSSCLFPTEGQVGGICSLTFSSATLVSLKAPGNSRTPLPRIHTPLSTHPRATVPSVVVANLQDREEARGGAARDVGPGWRAGRSPLPAQRMAPGSGRGLPGPRGGGLGRSQSPVPSPHLFPDPAGARRGTPQVIARSTGTADRFMKILRHLAGAPRAGKESSQRGALSSSAARRDPAVSEISGLRLPSGLCPGLSPPVSSVRRLSTP